MPMRHRTSVDELVSSASFSLQHKKVSKRGQTPKQSSIKTEFGSQGMGSLHASAHLALQPTAKKEEKKPKLTSRTVRAAGPSGSVSDSSRPISASVSDSCSAASCCLVLRRHSTLPQNAFSAMLCTCRRSGRGALSLSSCGEREPKR